MGPGKEKVKSAKKIQKDMEKWAKMLNQKSKMPINQVPYHSWVRIWIRSDTMIFFYLPDPDPNYLIIVTRN